MTQKKFFEDILGFSDLKITLIEKNAQKKIFYRAVKIKVSTCPNCLELTGLINQYETRKVQDLKISSREAWLHIRIGQFIFPTCKCYFFDISKWIAHRKSYTKRQAKWIFELCQQQAFSQVGALVNLSCKTVERLFFEMAENLINLPERYARVRKLGSDEISHRKGKKDNACVLTDLERGTQLEVLHNNNKEILIVHFQSIGVCFCNQIEVSCCDMWKPYIDMSEECFPNAETVIDRFHVVKSIKWVLLKRPEKCNETDFALLQNDFDKSWLLEEVYQSRNTFNSMFEVTTSSQQLEQHLNLWIEFPENLNYKRLNTFIRTLNNWKTYIAAFDSQSGTNAVIEGLNNYLCYFKRISLGVPNFKHIRLRILVASA